MNREELKHYQRFSDAWNEKLPTEFDSSIEQPVSREYAVANGVEIVQCVIPKASIFIPQHSHKYAHITLIPTGGLRVWKDGLLDKDYLGPAMIEIPALVKHTFMSLMPTVFYCVHRQSPTGKIEIHEEHRLSGLHPEDEVL